MLKRIALFFSMMEQMERVRETFTVKELCLLGRKLSKRLMTPWRLTRRSDQISAQQLLSREHIVGIFWLWSNGLRPTITVPLIEQKSLFYANVRVLRANNESEFNLWAQSETLQVALPLSHPIGRTVSQSQSRLSVLRPNNSSTFAHVNQTLSHRTNVWTNQDDV